MSVVSFADLYAGKIVAALDRQQPRDLFDVRGLLEHEGIDAQIRKAFLVYLLSHNRAMFEVLDPRRNDIAVEFDRGLLGMTEAPIALRDLEATREALIGRIVGDMPEDHRRFLISFEAGTPDWELLDVPHAKTLPAVQWNMRNLEKVGDARRNELVARLKAAIPVTGNSRPRERKGGGFDLS